MPSLELWSSALVARRKGLGLTQQQLADLSGVGVAFLYDLEHAKPTVRIDKLLAVLEVLGLKLELTEGRGPIGIDSKLTGEG